MCSATTTFSERLEILGYGSRDAYLEAEPTIEAKAKDMVAHYLTHVFPNGYKAQVVATSREAAVRYKKHIDAALAEAIAELEKANPEQARPRAAREAEDGRHHLRQPQRPAAPQAVSRTVAKHEASIKSFKLPFGSEDEGVTGDMGILIVNNMLLTGFERRSSRSCIWTRSSSPTASCRPSPA